MILQSTHRPGLSAVGAGQALKAIRAIRAFKGKAAGAVTTALLTFLAGCGGGSSGAAADAPAATPAVVTTVDVTPALGGVSAGVSVTLFNAQTGAVLAQGLTQQAPLGTARLSLRDFQGTVVVKVEGAAGATFYDERSGTAMPFPAGKVLLSVVADVGGGTAASLGVTPLTHALSTMLGVSAASFTGATFTPPPADLSASALNAQVDLLLATFGLTRNDVNLFAKPVVFGIDMVGRPASELKLAGTGNALAYGALLTALAKSIPAGTDLLDSANTLGSQARNGTLGGSGLLAAFAARFQDVVKDNLGSGVPVNFSPVITDTRGPGASAGGGSSSGSTSGSASGATSGKIGRAHV